MMMKPKAKTKAKKPAGKWKKSAMAPGKSARASTRKRRPVRRSAA
jgi:hypothetical protein